MLQNTCTSLLETFTVEQIKHHKDLTFKATQQQRNKLQKQQADKQARKCLVCQCSKLLYEPPALYCATCPDLNHLIKREQVYWSTPPGQQDSTMKGCWCNKCYTAAEQYLLLPGMVSALVLHTGSP